MGTCTNNILDKRHIFLGFLIIFGLYFLYKLSYPLLYISKDYHSFLTKILAFNKPIKMKLIKQNGTIENIDTPLNIDFENIFYIRNIYFPQSSELIHKEFGKLGFSANFFIEFKTKVYVKKEGFYSFFIASDDGFRFKVNGEIVGEHKENRPFTTSEIFLNLKKGTYFFELSYFQGYGPCGIIVYYKTFDSQKKYLFGKSSKYLKFIFPD